MRSVCMFTRSSIVLLAIALASLGCRDVAALSAPPELPDGAQQFEPPANYTQWWLETEHCAGRIGDMSRVRWFIIPNRTSFTYVDGQYDGYWWSRVHWIILAGEQMQNGMIVRHEMLHDLLGRGDHPAAYFQGRCAPIVACNGSCRSQG